MAGRQPFQCRAHLGAGRPSRPARGARVTGLAERPGNAGPVRPGGWHEGHDLPPVTVTVIRRSGDYFPRPGVSRRPNVPGMANTSTGNTAKSVSRPQTAGIAVLAESILSARPLPGRRAYGTKGCCWPAVGFYGRNSSRGGPAEAGVTVARRPLPGRT